MSIKQTRRYVVYDRYGTTASNLRPKSTWLNPRYWVVNAETNEVVDEFTTKSTATATARELNKEAR